MAVPKRRQFCFETDDLSQVPYSESEDLLTEISDFYSLPDLSKFNLNSYALQLVIFNVDEGDKKFNFLSTAKKITFVQKLMDQLEITDKSLRMNAARTLLYIAEGCASRNTMELTQQLDIMQENIVLLFKQGVFGLFVDLLKVETCQDYYSSLEFNVETSNARVILNFMYLTIQVLFHDKKKHKNEIDELQNELSDNVLLLMLFGMLEEFMLRNKNKYPVKKILLLIRKLIMFQFGTLADVEDQKLIKRTTFGLKNDHLQGPKHKVSKNDIRDFVTKSNLKYCGFDNQKTDFLPERVKEAVLNLEKFVYVPLSEVQISQTQNDLGDPIESLYEAMFPKIHVYLFALVKIFIVNNNTTCEKDDFNILGEILPNRFEKTALKDAKGHVLRQLELVNKGTTGVLLLLLKHLKLNHVYQFEWMCDFLVKYGSVRAFTLFLTKAQDYLLRRSENPANNFPGTSESIATLFNEKEYFSFEDMHYKESTRNLFTCVNLLRIINKLVKWKQMRIYNLINLRMDKVFKIVASTRNDHLKFYGLKILKIIAKNMPKKYRQNNMLFMSSIFVSLRPRLIEDWASEGELSNNFQDEEKLHEEILKFNNRYVEKQPDEQEYLEEPENDLTDYFKNNYETWLEQQVFQNPFNWDSLLNNDSILLKNV